MYPTYRHGRVSIVNHLAYRWKKPQRGDVVALRVPEENNAVFLKRIVGLPGETVEMKRGVVYINGKPLEEPYARAKQGRNYRKVVLEPGEYFVVGDYRRISVLGRVPEHTLVGKVLF
jgi:signal peptidase I